MRVRKTDVFTVETIKDILLSALLIIIGALGVARGYTWIAHGDSVMNSAPVYKQVAKFFPIQTLGLVFFTGGALVILAAFTRKRFAYFCLAIGGCLSAICGVIMYIASNIENINLYTPLSVGIVLSGNIIIMIAGVMMIWTEKRQETM